MGAGRLNRIWHDLRGRVVCLLSDQNGVSAVEFALLLPLMITMYLGTIEVSQGVAINRKIAITSRALSDLVSQVTSTTTTDLNNVMAAASAVMTPYPTGTLAAKVSTVDIDANGVAKIGWSYALNTSPRAKGSTVTVPAALNVPNTELIWSEVSYVFTPTIGYVVIGSITLSDQNYVRPRQSATVPCSNC
jgi:Flp pilus assembly protein TadG